MIQAAQPAVVLASASSTRQALLRAAGLHFTAMPAHVDEAALKEAALADGARPEDAAILLADAKARHVARRMPEALVLGADQLLICGDRWFDKPMDLPDAARHLHALSGKTHRLVNGLVAWRHGQRIWQHVASARMTMRDLSDAFITQYLMQEGAAVLGSVGAYRLEGLGMHLFDKVEGEHSVVLGLPMLPLLGFLRQQGIVLS